MIEIPNGREPIISTGIISQSKNVKYEVRFICYEYSDYPNFGGMKKCVKEFNTLERAIGFEKKVLQALAAKKSEHKRGGIWGQKFAEYFVCAGYVDKYEGIFLVEKTTTKIEHA